MKRLQQLCMTGLFTLVLTTATFAGDIHTGGAQPLPPDQSSAPMPGDIEAGAMSDSVADIVLNLLQTMLSAF